jgi:hypothetical protein
MSFNRLESNIEIKIIIEYGMKYKCFNVIAS